MEPVPAANDDAELLRLLATLPSYAPAPGFADRVMARVCVPAPAWLQTLRHIFHTVFNRETKWVWVSGMAASATFSIAVYTVMFMTRWAEVVRVAREVRAVLVAPLLGALAHAAAGVEHALIGRGAPVPSGDELAGIVMTGAVIVIGASWVGLRRTLDAYRRGHRGHHVAA